MIFNPNNDRVFLFYLIFYSSNNFTSAQIEPIFFRYISSVRKIRSVFFWSFEKYRLSLWWIQILATRFKRHKHPTMLTDVTVLNFCCLRHKPSTVIAVFVCVYYAMVFCDVWRWWWWWFSMMMANNDEPHFFSLKFCNSHSVHIGSCVRVSESKVNVRPIELLIRKASSPYVMWMMNNGSGYTSKIHRNKEEKKKNTKRNLTATPNTRTHQTR